MLKVLAPGTSLDGPVVKKPLAEDEGSTAGSYDTTCCRATKSPAATTTEPTNPETWSAYLANKKILHEETEDPT